MISFSPNARYWYFSQSILLFYSSHVVCTVGGVYGVPQDFILLLKRPRLYKTDVFLSFYWDLFFQRGFVNFYYTMLSGCLKQPMRNVLDFMLIIDLI